MSTEIKASPAAVRYEVADKVATIVLNRPHVFNNYNRAAVDLMRDYFRDAIADERVRGIVLGGEGKVFISGGELETFIRHIESRELWRTVASTEFVHELLYIIDRSPKPVVARVGGPALGGGFEFAMACDFAVASPAASFCFPETGLGIYPCSGGTQRTSRRIGVGLTKWLIYTGKTLSAAEALKMGLVHSIVPADQLDETCRAIALGAPCPRPHLQRTSQLAALERFFDQNRVSDLHAGNAETGGDPALARAMKSVGAKAPIALRLAERIIEEGSRVSLEEGIQIELAHVFEVIGTQDAYRGLTFRAKGGLGQPGFTGD